MTTATDQDNNSPELHTIGIEQELRKSYLDYAMSVIVGRALPDVRDGLKPVHRRTQRVPMGIFCQIVNVEAVNLVAVKQAESMGDQHRSFADLFGDLELTHFAAGFCRNFHVLAVSKVQGHSVRRIYRDRAGSLALIPFLAAYESVDVVARVAAGI